MRIQKIGVVGAGTMGAAIAELFAFNGYPVVLKDLTPELVQQGTARVEGLVHELVEFQSGRAPKEIERIQRLGITLTDDQRAALHASLRPKFTAEQGAEVVRRVTGVTSFDAFADVDLAIEAVFENAEAKREVFHSLDRVLPEEAVLATNTSSLSVTTLARGLRHAPESLVLHFFNPPSTLPLVEVAAGVGTRDDIATDAIAFLQGLHNHRYPLLPIRVREAPGFVVNRILGPLLNEACCALDEGVANARDIDAAMKAGAGLPMGPFELADLIGLDVSLEVIVTLHRELGEKYRPSPSLRRLVAAGHLGRKTGRGFYEYVTP